MGEPPFFAERLTANGAYSVHILLYDRAIQKKEERIWKNILCC